MKVFIRNFEKPLASKTGVIEIYSPKHSETRSAAIHGEANELGRLAFIPTCNVYWVDPSTEQVFDADQLELELANIFEEMTSSSQ